MKKAFCNGLENITMKNDDQILIQELLDSSNDNISTMSIITNTHPNFINISDAETEEQIINGIGKVDSILVEANPQFMFISEINDGLILREHQGDNIT